MLSLSDLLSNPVYLIICFAGILVIGIVLAFRKRRYPYYACDTLLTPAELKFYSALKRAVPADAAIMMKVRMADIINCDDRNWRAGWGPKISAKHIDFVLIDPKTTRILLAIELDDSTHYTNPDRIERDQFVNKAFEFAGVPLLRVNVQKLYNISTLATSIQKIIVSDQPRI